MSALGGMATLAAAWMRGETQGRAYQDEQERRRRQEEREGRAYQFQLDKFNEDVRQFAEVQRRLQEREDARLQETAAYHTGMLAKPVKTPVSLMPESLDIRDRTWLDARKAEGWRETQPGEPEAGVTFALPSGRGNVNLVPPPGAAGKPATAQESFQFRKGQAQTARARSQAFGTLLNRATTASGGDPQKFRALVNQFGPEHGITRLLATEDKAVEARYDVLLRRQPKPPKAPGAAPGGRGRPAGGLSPSAAARIRERIITLGRQRDDLSSRNQVLADMVANRLLTDRQGNLLDPKTDVYKSAVVAAHIEFATNKRRWSSVVKTLKELRNQLGGEGGTTKPPVDHDTALDQLRREGLL
jgi:hypothetical protein